MNIIIEIGHPAHVHQFKNFATLCLNKNHSVLFTVKKKEFSIELLSSYNLPYKIFGVTAKGLINKILGVLKLDYSLYKIAKKFKPDIFISRSSLHSGHVSTFLRKPHISFSDSDTDAAKYMLFATYPFVDFFITPMAYKKDLGKKHIRISSYKELGYLHPNYFKPKFSIVNKFGIKEFEKYAIIRFVSWEAYHDIHINSFDVERKIELVKILKKNKYRVLISSESNLPEELEKYKITVPSDEIHHLINYASLFIGDSQTMSSEAAILGTPAIRINSFVGVNDMSNFIELEKKFGLLLSFNPSENFNIEKVVLDIEKNYKKYKERRNNLLVEKIDVTAFMVWFIENYPESVRIMKENPDCQYNFK